MSGGVDSSVSAVLLQQQGYHVVGVYMKNWSKDLPGMQCPWAEDLADAKRVAVKLGLDFRIFDFEAEYKNRVVDYMLSEFKKGNTPNPDIMCNQEIKFKLFYDVAREQGADLIATGHYARIGQPDESILASNAAPAQLLRAVDDNKDQTYFLYRISEEAIQHTLFPIGHLTKPAVKQLAADFHLDTAHKKESMGVCFVGEVGLKDFLKEYLPPQQPGPIQDADTHATLGYHDGAIFYTIGQRRGLGLGGGLPYYVVSKDIKNNIVYVSKNLNHAALWTDTLQLKDLILRPTSAPSTTPTTNSTSITASVSAALAPAPQSPQPVLVRLRHRAPLIPATLETSPSQPASATAPTATLRFANPIKKPAAGQSAVLYAGPDHQICIGGGIIE